MRVVLRNKVSGRFWRADGTWTPQPGQAFDFQTAALALKRAVKSRLHDVEILVWFGGTDFRLVLPVGAGAPIQTSLAPPPQPAPETL